MIANQDSRCGLLESLRFWKEEKGEKFGEETRASLRACLKLLASGLWPMFQIASKQKWTRIPRYDVDG